MIATAIAERIAPSTNVDARHLGRLVGTHGKLLLGGEPGTGRETLARAIHAAQAGDGALEPHVPVPPFVVVDCASGRDADVALSGAFFRAQGGTLFIRALQRLSASSQEKFARVLRERGMWKDDGTTSSLSVARMHVIGAIDTPWDSDTDVLVPDLGIQFAGQRFDLPPLRHRRSDIPAVARAIAADQCRAIGGSPRTLSPAALALLSALTWRGNFNELRFVVQSLVANVNGRTIRVADVLTHIRIEGGDPSFSATQTLKDARERFEREHVLAALEQHHGRMSIAAHALGLQRTNLYRKMRQLGLRRRHVAECGDRLRRHTRDSKEQL